MRCEAGVRSLEREISKLCRKAVKQLLMDSTIKHIEINEGVRAYHVFHRNRH